MVGNRKEYEVKRRLNELKGLKGRGTELISLYIPEGHSIPEITAKLRDEYGQASNIKSKSTRKNVQSAINRILEYLKLFRKPPKSGMAIFCGNVISEQYKEGKVELFAIQPHKPVDVQLYRCDSSFFLEPLIRMLGAKDKYAIFAIDKREATIARIDGNRIEIIRRLTSTVPGKTRAGGQSSARFERLRETAKNDFFVRVGDSINENLDEKVKGIVAAGPGTTKFDFINGNYMRTDLKKKIIGSVDTGYTNESGIKEALDKSDILLAEQELIKEKKILDRFMREVIKGKLAVYGLKEVVETLKRKQVGRLLISESTNVKKFVLKCSCGKRMEKITLNPGEFRSKEYPCECGKKYQLAEEKDALKEILDEAERQGIDIIFLSDETTEGAQFKNGFGGIGAFLRYR